MRDIVGDLSDTKLVKTVIRAIWENYHYCLGRSSSVELSVGKYLTWLVTNMPDHFMKLVAYTKLPSQGVDKLIENALNNFKAFNIKDSLGSPFRTNLALLDGEPVATSQRSTLAGVAGIYNVSCLPQARRQGGGTTAFLTPLLTARKMGYHAGILQASSMGYNVYRRLGFQDFGKLSLYLWEQYAND